MTTPVARAEVARPTPQELLAAALTYAGLGWRVLPLHTPLSGGGCSCGRPDCPPQHHGKHPRTPHGLHDATTDPEIIREWWTRWPTANIGIVTGEQSGIIVLDVDGPEGQDALRELSLPLTPAVTTGKGTHYYLAHPARRVPNAVRILPGVDLRGDGGYVVAPPSLHPCGRRYTWAPGLSPNDAPLAPPPDWLLERLHDGRPRVVEPVLAEPIPEGKRNTTLTRVAGALRRQGLDEAGIRAALEAINRERCVPPLPPEELAAIARSVAKYPAGPAGGDDETDAISWPDPPAEDAYHGLAGEWVRMIEPHTEADPIALLVQFLVAAGNMIGRGPYYLAEADEHHLNLFAVLVGQTAKGRKGTSVGHVLRVMRAVDETWAAQRVQAGLSSGEGLIWAVRDPIERREPIRENKRIVGYEPVVVDEGVSDKRLLILETEFASVLRVLGRDGNTLSAIVRQAWGGGDLRVMTKNSPATATGAHISIIGHITADELRRYLDSTEAGNGFGNRILWVCVRRSKYLPLGGQAHTLDFAPLVRRLREAVEYARSVGRITLDDAATAIWCAVYPDLSEGKPGLLGAVTSRAEAQTARLATLYAVLDASPVIRAEHLRAALALWTYCEASARYIFGDAVGDPVADEILRALRAAPGGLTRTEIRDLFGRNRSGREIGRALARLAEHGLARFEREQGEDGGRPVERWFATRATTTKTTLTTKPPPT